MPLPADVRRIEPPRPPPVRPGLKGLWLFLLPLPLLFKAVFGLWGGSLSTVLACGVPYALTLAGALAVRRGIVAEAVQARRSAALGARLPFKSIGAALIGVATAAAAYLAAGHDALIAALFGIGAGAGVALTYGLDAARRVLTVAADAGVGADEVAAALKAAYGKLERIETVRLQIRAPEFQERLGAIVGASDRILKHIEEDPRDLRRARKFLNVYLDGVLGVSEQYVRTQPKAASPSLEQNYRQLLDDMEKVCGEQYDTLVKSDVRDLDIHIDVLSTRLKREGVIS